MCVPPSPTLCGSASLRINRRNPKSVVMGQSTVALPAKAIKPTCWPSSMSPSSESNSILARSSRFGVTSSANIDLLTSRQIMICEVDAHAALHTHAPLRRIRATTSDTIASDRRASAARRCHSGERRTRRGCMIRETSRSSTDRPRNSRKTSSRPPRRPATAGESSPVPRNETRSWQPPKQGAAEEQGAGQQAQAGPDEIGKMLACTAGTSLRSLPFVRVRRSPGRCAASVCLVHRTKVLACRLLGDLLQRLLVNLDRAGDECRPAEEVDGWHRRDAPRAGADAVDLDVLLPGQFGGFQRLDDSGVR